MPTPPRRTPSPSPSRPPRRSSLRTTETPLELPTVGRALAILGRTLRLRCPHCGGSPVLTRRARVRERCRACGFRYQRSDDNYFSGAMFFGLMIGEAVFGLSLLATVVITWPDVPWDALGYIAPIGMIAVMLMLLPLSKVAWLAIDVLVRPVTLAEIQPPPSEHESGRR